MMSQQLCNTDSQKSVLLPLLAVQISSLIAERTLKGTRNYKVLQSGLVSNVNCQSAKINTMKYYWQVFGQVRFNLFIATPSPVSQHISTLIWMTKRSTACQQLRARSARLL